MCFEGNDVPEKRKRDQFKKLVSGIVGVRIKLQFGLLLHPLPLCQTKINFDSPHSDISKGTIDIDRVCWCYHCFVINQNPTDAYHAIKTNVMVISIGFPKFLLIRVVKAT